MNVEAVADGITEKQAVDKMVAICSFQGDRDCYSAFWQKFVLIRQTAEEKCKSDYAGVPSITDPLAHLYFWLSQDLGRMVGRVKNAFVEMKENQPKDVAQRLNLNKLAIVLVTCEALATQAAKESFKTVLSESRDW